MDGPTTAYAELLDAIDTSLRGLPRTADGSGDVAAQRTRLTELRLQADRLETELHSRITNQPVTYGEAAFCAECGEPAPCPTIRRLLTEYDVTSD